MSNYDKVREFQLKFDLPVGRTAEPALLPARGMEPEEARWLAVHIQSLESFIRTRRTEDDQMWGRVQMMLEELRELIEAVAIGDLEAAADSLVDLDYFLLGTAVMMGLPYDALFAEVHRANMDKVRVESAAEGKRLNKLDCKKPAGWVAPRIAQVLAGAALSALLLLVGCEPTDAKPIAASVSVVAEDTAHGVVCYAMYGDARSLACVKVAE